MPPGRAGLARLPCCASAMCLVAGMIFIISAHRLLSEIFDEDEFDPRHEIRLVL